MDLVALLLLSNQLLSRAQFAYLTPFLPYYILYKGLICFRGPPNICQCVQEGSNPPYNIHCYHCQKAFTAAMQQPALAENIFADCFATVYIDKICVLSALLYIGKGPPCRLAC